jgi:hypothetical protein
MEDSMPKWMRDLFAGWPMIRANLPTFFVILVLIVGAIWIVVNWSYSALLASKNGQIELQDRQIGDYKAKQVSEPTKAPLLSPAPKEHPEFLKNVSFAWDSQLPLGLSGTFAVTKPKLRIYVDAASFSISMPGTNRFRAEIGSVADAVKGQNFAMQLIRFAKDDSGRAFWRPDAGAKLCGDDPRSDGGKRARSPGRARISRKTIARGKPVDSG